MSFSRSPPSAAAATTTPAAATASTTATGAATAAAGAGASAVRLRRCPAGIAPVRRGARIAVAHALERVIASPAARTLLHRARLIEATRAATAAISLRLAPIEALVARLLLQVRPIRVVQ